MAHVDSFHYSHGTGFLHALDERLKIVLVLAYCTVATVVRPTGLVVLAAGLFAAILLSGFRIAALVRELAGFCLFLAVVFLLSAYSVQGDPFFLFFVPLPSTDGLVSGLLLVSRLLLVLFAGALFSGTTIQTRLVAAARSILSRVPFVPAPLVATMMGLSISSVPLLLDTFGEISDALRSRCGDRLRNPVKKIVAYAKPLFTRLFVHADEIADAMESRCYNGDFTAPAFAIRAKDLVVFFSGIAVCALSLVIGFVFP